MTIILALYVLGLSVWPCADAALPANRQEQGAVLIAASAPVHDNHDACTPFCTCACCTATISITPHFSYSVMPMVELVPIATAIFQYVPLHWASPLSAIWQPPQLRA
ncbi:DUF6660 family protein [Fibrella rubiginis]|uniref:DUF6660 family protein n=1 Tax=Fibrella rubiginis TaxID=2817060 RepID=UPI00286EA03E|nr:DUF6660 family protein [Fibrella rubiginis]